MSEFINREDAIEAMTTARDTHSIEMDGEDYISYDMAQNFLRELPSSTALDKLFEARFDYEQEPKTGHWKYNKCDKCGSSRPPLFDYYCPNCGAKMVESEDKI